MQGRCLDTIKEIKPEKDYFDWFKDWKTLFIHIYYRYLNVMRRLRKAICLKPQELWRQTP